MAGRPRSCSACCRAHPCAATRCRVRIAPWRAQGPQFRSAFRFAAGPPQGVRPLHAPCATALPRPPGSRACCACSWIRRRGVPIPRGNVSTTTSGVRAGGGVGLLVCRQVHRFGEQWSRPSLPLVPAEEALARGLLRKGGHLGDAGVTASADGAVGEQAGKADGPGPVHGDDALDVAVQGDGDGRLARPGRARRPLRRQRRGTRGWPRAGPRGRRSAGGRYAGPRPPPPRCSRRGRRPACVPRWAGRLRVCGLPRPS